MVTIITEWKIPVFSLPPYLSVSFSNLKRLKGEKERGINLIPVAAPQESA